MSADESLCFCAGAVTVYPFIEWTGKLLYF